jgi:hypothetical protein
MKSLGRDDDVKSSQKAMEQDSNFFISIPDAKTPWYLHSLDYAEGFVHWYDIGSGPRRTVCGGGIEHKGFATDDCPICAHVLSLYQEAKELMEEGGAKNETMAKKLKDRAFRIKGKYEVQFKAIRGQRTLIKTTHGGKVEKHYEADFGIEDEDNTVAVGIISLSEPQYSALLHLIKGPDTPFIQTGTDLGKRVLWTQKVKRKGKVSKYSVVEWTANEEEDERPEIEIPEELNELDLEKNFEIDMEELEKIANSLSGQEPDEVEEDEEVELEDDSDDEPENADLDDLPEDDDESVDDDEEYEEEDEGDYEEEEEEETVSTKSSKSKPKPFEDDLLDDDEEELPKASKRRVPVPIHKSSRIKQRTSSQSKTAPSSKGKVSRTSGKRSGKARM